MNKALMGRTVRVVAGFGAIAATSIGGAGCENRHVLGAVNDDGATPPHLVDAGMAEVIMIPPPDGRPELPDGAGPITHDGAVINPDGPVTQDGAVINPDGPIAVPTESWTGYIANYGFPSGSDAVRIAFAADPAGQLVGTVTLGRGTPPPPATDPNVGYPADLLTKSPLPDLTSAARNYTAEGFGYSMREGSRTGNRLRFQVRPWELWDGWCALQTPVPPTGMCDEPVCAGTCLPNWGSMQFGDGRSCALRNPTTDQYEPVDCGKLALCNFGHVCTCDVSTCVVGNNGTTIAFDVAITGDLAAGSVSGGPIGNRNVHFTKDP